MDAKNKEKEAKMAKIDTKRKEFETEDEKYSIILPKKLSEIVIEGKTLGHCVGSYTNSHAIGTTIMFLRRKDALTLLFIPLKLRTIRKNLILLRFMVIETSGLDVILKLFPLL